MAVMISSRIVITTLILHLEELIRRKVFDAVPVQLKAFLLFLQTEHSFFPQFQLSFDNDIL